MLLNAMVIIFGVIAFCRKVEVEFLIKNQDKKEGGDSIFARLRSTVTHRVKAFSGQSSMHDSHSVHASPLTHAFSLSRWNSRAPKLHPSIQQPHPTQRSSVT